MNALEANACSSSDSKRRRFRSSLFLYYTVHWCIPFSNLYSTSMPHRGTVGGVGYPPPVAPQCPGCAGARSSLALPSALPPGHFTLQLDRALVLIFQ